MPPDPEPKHRFQLDEIQEEELQRALKRARSRSFPSPKDQIPYRVLEGFPAVIAPLLHIFNLCWSTGKIPQQWKQAVIRLVPKPAAKDNPQDLSSFRPIALTSCIGKVYTSILKQRLMSFMNSNKYIDSETQKAFLEGVHGCTEHQNKLRQAILDARRNQRNITVCWLDLANAFGSLHQNLITYAPLMKSPARSFHSDHPVIILGSVSSDLLEGVGDPTSAPGQRPLPRRPTVICHLQCHHQPLPQHSCIRM